MSDPIYDLVGVGFGTLPANTGPANLALCIALHESDEAKLKNFSMLFLEKQPQFAWHPSLLLPGAQLQVSPIKDLATMRDPTSAYTFLNFLHCQGRLVQYINREEKVPSRKEWSAYLAWAAQRMNFYTRYSRSVVDIEPVERNGVVDHLRISAKNTITGEVEIVLARNVTTAVGGSANVPDVFKSMYNWSSSDPETVSRVVHASTFLPQMARLEKELQRRVLDPDAPRMRLAVIGGGQSSAEMLTYLRDRFPGADLDMLVRASALVPSDDSPFVNSAAFDPASVSTFWESSARVRRAQLDEFKRTNYSVVRNDLLSHVYEMVYDQEIDYHDPYMPEKGTVRIMANTVLENAESLEDGSIRITSNTTTGGSVHRSDVYDAVFLGTGFQRAPNTLPFIHTLAKHFPMLSPDGVRKLHEHELMLDDQIAAAPEPDVARALARGITRDYRLVPSDLSRWCHDASYAVSVHPSVLERIPQSRVGREGSRESSVASDKPREMDSGYSSTHAPSSPVSESGDPMGRCGAPANVYLFGCNEYTHGLSDSLMSMVAHRAGVVSASLLAATP